MNRKNLDILIRADANTEIGTGHVMRCLALAQTWQDFGGTAHFVCAEVPVGLATRLMAEGMVLHHLSEAPGGRQDAQRTVALAQQVGATWVVEDGYHFGADYQRAIKDAGLRLLAIDDYGQAEHYVADLVLNQNICADESLYPNRETTTQVLLGTKYALLRREFWPWRGWRRTIPDVAPNILVTMGGGDPDNQTLKVIRAIQQIDGIDLSVIVVVGGGNPHLATLESAIADTPFIRLLQNVINMPELMAWADVAISAGGSTCWELALMGLPNIILILAQNQEPIATALGQAGISINLGSSERRMSTDITIQLNVLICSHSIRQQMSDRGVKLVDGFGAERVVNRLRHVGGATGSLLFVRPACLGDAEDLWFLANDPAVRGNSFSPDPIPYDAHLKWLERKLASPDTRIWMIEQEGLFIGQVRFDRLDQSAEIDFAVVPSFRGHGIGTELLRLTSHLACDELRVSTLRGVVKNQNEGSSKAFLRAGFVEASEGSFVEGVACRTFVWRCNQTVKKSVTGNIL